VRVDERILEMAWEWAADSRAGELALSRAEIAKLAGVAKSPTLIKAIEWVVKSGVLLETDGQVKGRAGKVYIINPQAVEVIKSEVENGSL